MMHSATNPVTHPRRRFGLTEVLLIVAILAFGAFSLVNDGRTTLGTLFAGFEDVLRG